ncbi:MAG: pitrilysin family protein [Pseudomonadota bacterium]
MTRILALLVLLTLPATVYAQNQKTFGAEGFILKNGMEVVVIPNHRAPIVTHMVWYKVGAADEPYGQSGMAHYFEHLMFKGTKKLQPGEFSTTVRKLGGNDNAFTSQDYTAYFQSIAVENLETVMKMEADRMLNLAPPPEHYKSEKNVVIEERRQRTENDPRGLFFEQLRNTLFVNHPYGTPTIGWMSEIETYEWEDVKSFYDTWYAPNNAILIVSGDITAEELQPMAERAYGRLPTKEVPERIRPIIPPIKADSLLTFQDSSIRQSALHKIYLAPSENQIPQHSHGLQVLNEVLSGGPTTRLYKSLVVDQKKATSVSLGYTANMLDYSSIYISATPAEGIPLNDLENLIETEIQKIIKEGVSAEEVEEAIKRLQDQAVFARDSVAGPAMIFGRILTTGGTIDDVEGWTENISLVSPTLVQEVARLYLNEAEPWVRAPVVGHMLPEVTQ